MSSQRRRSARLAIVERIARDVSPGLPPRAFSQAVPPERYQRLVANPFLALAGLFFWIAALLLTFEHEQYGLSVPLFACLAIVFWWLPQYHCRDCGKTGRLDRWREHACDAVQARIQASQPLQFRGPTVRMQMVVWGLAVIAVFVVLLKVLIP
jgi:hypothetical protein